MRWKRVSCLIAAFFMACAAVSGLSMQTAASADSLQRYSGVWQATLKGTTNLTIRLEMRDGKLTGSTNRVDLGIGKDGEVANADPLDGSEIITQAILKNDTLRVVTEDDQDLQLELRLTGADQGELRLLDLSDHPVAKPLALHRVTQ
jgi:hypothetical protein